MFKKPDKILITVVIAVLLLIGIGQQKNGTSFSDVRGEEESAGKLKLYFLDIGQGDATLIRTPQGQDILIDGGPDNTVIQKLGEYLPVGDWDIELMILTHPHADHVTGLVEVLKRYEVDKVITTGVLHTSHDYLNWLSLIAKQNIPVQIIKQPEKIIFEDGVELNILFPDRDLFGKKIDNLNNTSIVTKLVYGNISALFTGDLEMEEYLVDNNIDVQADIYQVGHHGSNTGNSLDFLRAVNSDYAVISVGENNRFGHPHYRTVKNLNDLNLKVFRTDIDGDVILSSDGVKVYVE